jgi:transcriptional regulator with XRE-family HTH domain
MKTVRKTRTLAAAPEAADASPIAVLGQRIRRLRIQAGLSLRAQAREIGIAPSSLSALENGQGGVSIKRLQLVGQHFGLHITELLGEPGVVAGPKDVEIIRNCAAEAPGVSRGTGVQYQLLGTGRDHVLQPYLISFEPGGGYERDMIGHPGEEIAYVLLGRVELVFENESHGLNQGDLIRFGTDEPHAFRNASRVGTAAILGAATPPW